MVFRGSSSSMLGWAGALVTSVTEVPHTAHTWSSARVSPTTFSSRPLDRQAGRPPRLEAADHVGDIGGTEIQQAGHRQARRESLVAEQDHPRVEAGNPGM